MRNLLLASIITALFVIGTKAKREYATVPAFGNGSFTVVNERGVVIANKYSLVFQVQACGSAVIALSDITHISESTGHYFIIVLGISNNSQSQILDSCFGCDSTSTVTSRGVLHCTEFRSFWITWTPSGLVQVGTGTSLRAGSFLTYQGKNKKYDINVLQATSMYNVSALFKFPLDSPLLIKYPAPDGSTVVAVSENQNPNITLLQMTMMPEVPKENILSGPGHDYFELRDGHIRLVKKLDFEEKSFYNLVITTPYEDTVGFIIVVKDENDETPSLSVHHVAVPEELPVGTVIGGIYTAVDRDKGDNLTFALSGSGHQIFKAIGEGQLKVIGRLDRERFSSNEIFSNLTMTVTDLAGHTVRTALNVSVLDVNDNAPLCRDLQKFWIIPEGKLKDTVLGNLSQSCFDLDEGDNAKLNFSFLAEDWVMPFINFSQGAITLQSEQLNLEDPRQGHHFQIVVIVSDCPKTERKRTTYVEFIIKVLPVNEFPPYWLSGGNGAPISVLARTPVGTVIAHLVASDPDVGDDPLKYAATSIKTGTGRSGFKYLSVDGGSGNVTVTRSLKGIKSFSMKVKASDDTHSITSQLLISVSDASPTVHTVVQTQTTSGPKFDRRIYRIWAPSLSDKGRSLLEFDVKNITAKYSVIVKGGGALFEIVKSAKWGITLAGSYKGTEHISDVITLQVKKKRTDLVADEAYVIVTDRKSPKPKRCRLTTSVLTKSIFGVAAAQSVILGTFLVKYLYGRLSRGRKRPTIVPIRRDPLGCADNELPKEVARRLSKGHEKVKDKTDLLRQKRKIIRNNSMWVPEAVDYVEEGREFIPTKVHAEKRDWELEDVSDGEFDLRCKDPCVDKFGSNNTENEYVEFVEENEKQSAVQNLDGGLLTCPSQDNIENNAETNTDAHTIENGRGENETENETERIKSEYVSVVGLEAIDGNPPAEITYLETSDDVPNHQNPEIDEDRTVRCKSIPNFMDEVQGHDLPGQESCQGPCNSLEGDTDSIEQGEITVDEHEGEITGHEQQDTALDEREVGITADEDGEITVAGRTEQEKNVDGQIQGEAGVGGRVMDTTAGDQGQEDMAVYRQMRELSGNGLAEREIAGDGQGQRAVTLDGLEGSITADKQRQGPFTVDGQVQEEKAVDKQAERETTVDEQGQGEVYKHGQREATFDEQDGTITVDDQAQVEMTDTGQEQNTITSEGKEQKQLTADGCEHQDTYMNEIRQTKSVTDPAIDEINIDQVETTVSRSEQGETTIPETEQMKMPLDDSGQNEVDMDGTKQREIVTVGDEAHVDVDEKGNVAITLDGNDEGKDA